MLMGASLMLERLEEALYLCFEITNFNVKLNTTVDHTTRLTVSFYLSLSNIITQEETE